MTVASKTEDYQLFADVLDQGLKRFRILSGRPERGAICQRQATCLGPLLQQGRRSLVQILLALFGDCL